MVVTPGSWWSTLHVESSTNCLEGLVFPELLDLGRHLSPGVVHCGVSPACVKLLVGGWMLLSI